MSQEQQQYAITRDQAREIAEEMIYDYLTADYGKRITAISANPTKAYLQDTNTWSQGEIFDVSCSGIWNQDLSSYREGWDCDHLDDYDVIKYSCENGDMSDDIEWLTEAIWESVIENYERNLKRNK